MRFIKIQGAQFYKSIGILLIIIWISSVNTYAQNNEGALADVYKTQELTEDKQSVILSKLKTVVTLKKSQQNLITVLESIARQAGLKLSYSKQFIPLDKKIDVKETEATAETALWRVLRDTPFRFGISASGQLVLLKMKQLKSSKMVQEPISGTVTDGQSGETLPGVNVIIKGTTTGTSTDSEGAFELTVESLQDTLIFSFVGYQTQEVPINGRTQVDIVLQPQAIAGEELVVTGYSSTEKAQLTSSVNVVSEENLQGVETSNIFNQLQGKAPGVIVSRSSGNPNSSPKINIRGSSSISANSSPLIVVDGMITENGSNINPEDINTVTILKDAAATAKYGSRAANGVIVITTKKGQKGRTKVNIETSVGQNTASRGNFSVMDSRELYEYEKTFYPPDRFANEIPESVLSQNTDWVDLALRHSLTQSYFASVSGGSEDTQFYLSGEHYNEEGTIKFNYRKRYGVRANIYHNLNNNFSIDFKINAKHVDQQNDPSGLGGALRGAYTNMPWDNPYNSDGTIRKGTEGKWYGRENENFLHGWKYNFSPTDENEVEGDLNLKYNIFSNLELSSYNRLSYNSFGTTNYEDVRTKAGKGRGRLSESVSHASMLLTSNRLSYSNTFGKHSIDALGVIELQKNYSENNYTLADGFAPGLYVLDAASNFLNASGNRGENNFTKGLLIADYNFNDRYFLSGSYTNETSSKFGKNNKSANFYSVGASWILSNESFLSDGSFIDFLKMRISYGTSGNAGIGNYQSLGLYTYSVQYAGNAGALPFQISNRDLTWEKINMLNFGLDFGISNRLDLEFDFYNKKSDGLLLNVDIPYTSGFSSITRNIGSIRNRGLEISATSTNINGRFQWTTNFNIALNRSKVLSLYKGKDVILGNKIIREGNNLNIWYMRKWAGVDPKNGDPLWEKIITGSDGEQKTTITNSYSDATLQEVGNASPDFTGALGNTFSYKGFSLSTFINFVYGNSVYNSARTLFDSDGAYYTYNNMVLADDWSRWEEKGDIATHPKAILGGNKNSNKPSSRYLEDGSYIRLRNLTFAYDLPKKLLNTVNTSNAKVFISGDNLWTWSAFSGMDPEVELGINGGTSGIKYPISKRLLVGINIEI